MISDLALQLRKLYRYTVIIFHLFSIGIAQRRKEVRENKQKIELTSCKLGCSKM